MIPGVHQAVAPDQPAADSIWPISVICAPRLRLSFVIRRCLHRRRPRCWRAWQWRRRALRSARAQRRRSGAACAARRCPAATCWTCTWRRCTTPSSRRRSPASSRWELLLPLHYIAACVSGGRDSFFAAQVARKLKVGWVPAVRLHVAACACACVCIACREALYYCPRLTRLPEQVSV